MALMLIADLRHELQVVTVTFSHALASIAWLPLLRVCPENNVRLSDACLTCARSLKVLDSRERFAALPSAASPAAGFLPGVGVRT